MQRRGGCSQVVQKPHGRFCNYIFGVSFTLFVLNIVVIDKFSFVAFDGHY